MTGILSRETLKRARTWAARFACGLLALVLAAGAVAQTPWAKGLAAEAAAGYCLRELGWTLELSPLEGVLPFAARVASIRLADREGEWLSASDVSLSIVPWPFGTGAASLQLVADQAEVRRAPASAPEPEPAPPAPHPLAFLDVLEPVPVNASLRARVNRLTLDAPLTGRAVAGRVDFSASASGGAVQAALTLSARAPSETRGAPGADVAVDAEGAASTDVSLEMRLDPAARTARLRLVLAEAAGGLAAALAGLAPDAPLSATCDGDGPLSDWRAAFAVRSGRQEPVSGTVRLGLGRASSDDARADLALGVETFFLPLSPEVRKALGSRVDLAFSGVMTRAGSEDAKWRVVVDELRVAAANVAATVRGDSGPMGLAPRLRFALNVADPASLGLKTGSVAVDGELNAEMDPAGPLSADVRLSSPDLASLLAPLRIGLGGKANLAVKVTGDIGAQDVRATLDAELAELAAVKGHHGPELVAALGREVALRVEASLSGAKLVTVKHLRVSAKGLRADVSGSYDMAAGTVDARADVDAPDLADLTPLAGVRLAGSVAVRARARGNANAPWLALDAQAKGLGLDRTRFDLAEAHLAAMPQNGGVGGQFDLRAHRGKDRLSVSTAFALVGRKVSLTALQAAGPGLSLSGALHADLDRAAVAGRVKALADLAPLGAFLNGKMTGRMQAEVSLAAPGQRQDIAVRAQASAVAAQGFALKSGELAGSLTDILGSPRGDLALTLTAATAGGTALESLQAWAHGGETAVDCRIEAKVARPQRLDLSASGAFTPAAGGGTVRLDALEASAREARLALVRPATFAFGPGTMRLDGLALSLNGATITAGGSLKPGAVDFSADVAAFPLALLEQAGLPALSGLATVSLRATGAPQAPRVSAEVALDHVAAGNAGGHNRSAARVTAEASLAGGSLRAACHVSAGQGAAFHCAASLPARLSLAPFGFFVPRDAALEGSVSGEVDIARLAELSGDEALSLKGALKADFTVSGRLSAPMISGRATLEGGQAEYVTTGTSLRDITLDLQASGAKAVLKTFSARDSGQGRLWATGAADFSPAGGFPFTLDLTADKLTPVHTDLVTAVLSAKVNVSGGADGAKVSGGVNVGPVDVNIADRMPSGATPIAVEMAGPGGAPAALPVDAAEPYPVRLDVAVDFPGRIFVRGMGLDSMWAGNIRVQGTAGEPSIGGAIRIVKGQLDFFGKNFNLARGEVTFHGATPPQPMLDLEAKTQAGDITASILVSGIASHPAIDFTSDPAVPRDEILARVLFGQSVSSLTPPQALQLAQAVATMSGAGGSLDFLGATRKLVGLDYLGVKSSGQSIGQSAVAAGKYVADGVYVEASQGLSGTSGAVSVEIDVTRNITVESKIGLDSKAGVGVNWKFDY